jgi:effector-binding domain-containing protein
MNAKPVVSLKHVDNLLVATIRLRGAYEQVPVHFRLLREEVGPYVTGKRMLLYHYAGSDVEVECCLPVSRPVDTAQVRSRILAGGDAWTLLHHGPYQTLGESWSLLFDYVEGHNIRVQGPRREVYLDDREFAARGHLTELQVLVAP